LQVLHRAPAHERRVAEERSEYARVSAVTLRYMWDAALALEAWLRWHGRNLLAASQEEYDLYEAMRLSARLSSVRTNTGRLERQIDGLRAELVRRELDGS
jgi:hypothetical protein